MPKCAVDGCLSKNRKNISYFSLPKDVIRREQWLNACNIESFESRGKEMSIKICSLHFKNYDYVIEQEDESTYAMVLKKNAIPNIDDILKLNKSRSRTQKREIRSYVLDTQRRLAVNASFDKYSLHTLSNLSLSSCRYNSALLCKIFDKENELYKLQDVIQKLRRKNKKMKCKYKYWKKLALK